MLGKLAVLASLFFGQAAYAETAGYQLNFGPFIGSGSISNQATVRQTSGYSLAVERNFAVNDRGLSIGPRFEMTNGFVSTRETYGANHTTATYNNRFFAAGFRISQTVGAPHTFAQGIYLSALAGKGYSKLSMDDTAIDNFSQRTYGNISGNFFSGELGAWIPLKDRFGINLAILDNMYQANQQEAHGTYEQQVQRADGISLTSGSYQQGAGLDEKVTMKTIAGRVGLSLGF